MSIDTGLNLVFNPNFPVPGLDQPSQQFRDNFFVIKTAVENLQTLSSSSESIFSLSTAQDSSTGLVQATIGYNNNALLLPVSDPTGSGPIAGMIRYAPGASAAVATIQFYDGAEWRNVVAKDINGTSLTLSTLTVSTRLTLGYTPTQATDAVPLNYVQAVAAYANSALAAQAASQTSATQAVQTDLNTEKTARQSGDTNLQNQINALEANSSSYSSNASSTQGQITAVQQSVSDEANARIAADNSQVGSINGLTTRVSAVENLASDLSVDIQQEVVDRQSGDQTLSDLINAITSADSAGLSAEMAARIAGDAFNANAIQTVATNLAAETTARTVEDSSLQTQINAKVDKNGNSAILVSNAPVTIESGTFTLANSALVLPNSDFTLDSNRFFYFNDLHQSGAGDGAYITFDQNNFMYAKLDVPADRTAINNAISSDITTNSTMTATNLAHEFSCLRLASTNDGANEVNSDSIAIEPSAHLYLNPGWSGSEDTTTPESANASLMTNGVVSGGNAEGRTPVTGSYVIVGNAFEQMITMSRDTGNITTLGSITAQGDVSGLSDVSLKSDVETIQDALTTLMSLRGTTFTRNDLPGTPRQMGVIAQELQPHVPEVIHETKDGLLSVAYGNLTALLIEAVKELKAEVDDLRSQIQS